MAGRAPVWSDRMVPQPKLLVCLVLAACLCGGTPAATRVRVTGDHVNLRARPGGGDRAEVVSQVSRGDELAVKSGLDADWVEVAAPATASVWVYGELVKDGVVAATKVRVRGGPDLAWQPVGRVERGDKLTLRGRKGDWLEIAPPPGTSLFVSRDYVEPIALEAPSPPPTPPKPEPTPVAVKPVAPPPPKPVPPKPVTVTPAPEPPVRVGLPGGGTAAPPPSRPRRPAPVIAGPDTGSRLPVGLAGRTLVPSKMQGQTVTYAGVVSSSGLVWRRPSRYRLAEQESGRALTVCYVLGNEAQLRQILGQRVTIHGREYWIQGVRSSVVVPDRIVRR
jgi:hypothetical protein